MARSDFTLDAEAVEKLQYAMDMYGRGCGRIIDDVLHKQGGKLISDEIMNLLPQSGRSWKGKKKAAKSAQPFTQEDRSLSVTVRTKSAYHYLYFPDDGTNTKNHKGEQYFMIRGAENQSEKIIDLCVGELIKGFFEGE